MSIIAPLVLRDKASISLFPSAVSSFIANEKYSARRESTDSTIILTLTAVESKTNDTLKDVYQRVKQHTLRCKWQTKVHDFSINMKPQENTKYKGPAYISLIVPRIALH